MNSMSLTIKETYRAPSWCEFI